MNVHNLLRNATATSVLAAAIVAWWQSSHHASAQPPLPSEPSTRPATLVDLMRRTRSQLAQQSEELKQASTDEARKPLLETLKTACGEYFDLDMMYRREEIQRLTERTKETSTRLDRRETSKAELVGLQLKLFQNDAEGMAFFGGSDSGNSAGAAVYERPQRSFQLDVSPSRGTDVRNQNRYEWLGANTLYPPGPNTVATPAPPQWPVYGPPTMLRSVQAAPEQLKAVNDEWEKIQEARRSFVAAEEGNAKATALNGIQTALEEYFDADMKRRRAEVEAIQAKLRAMLARLEKREKSRGEIIELQVKRMQDEADGLGFFLEEPTQGGNLRYGPFTAPSREGVPAVRAGT